MCTAHSPSTQRITTIKFYHTSCWPYLCVRNNRQTNTGLTLFYVCHVHAYSCIFCSRLCMRNCVPECMEIGECSIPCRSPNCLLPAPRLCKTPASARCMDRVPGGMAQKQPLQANHPALKCFAERGPGLDDPGPNSPEIRKLGYSQRDLQCKVARRGTQAESYQTTSRCAEQRGGMVACSNNGL